MSFMVLKRYPTDRLDKIMQNNNGKNPPDLKLGQISFNIKFALPINRRVDILSYPLER